MSHEKRVEIRWSDVDAYMHVNNAVYATYFEERPLDPFVATLLEVRCVDRVVDVHVGVDVAPSNLDTLLMRHGWRS